MGHTNRYKTIRIHQGSYDLLNRIADNLRAKASKGMAIPVRIDLGIVHLVDYAVQKLSKEVGIR